MLEPICREVYRGQHLHLQVLDRDLASVVTHEEAYAVISITEVEKPFPRLAASSLCQDVLRLRFTDVEEAWARLRVKTPHIVPFSTELAQQIAAFAQAQVESGTRLIVLHCEAGMSRSAGVASALSLFYNHDETFFLVHYRPNVYVRRLVLEALNTLQKSGEEDKCESSG